MEIAVTMNIPERFIYCIYNQTQSKVRKQSIAFGRRKTSLQILTGNTSSAPRTVPDLLVGANTKRKKERERKVFVIVHP